ncbi:MAG: T9SS type A sorting domain-containing protein [Chitinophagaceae bacterium]|nr:T9SS type A sorting domain-containing protein [Chitinophagaceae bacterium]
MKKFYIILFTALLISPCTVTSGNGSFGFSEFQTRFVRLYPNPATTFITFDLQKNYRSGLTLHIFSGILGKKVYSAFNIPQKLTINLAEFTNGIYVYHLTDASGRLIESGKFQVSK